MTQEELKDRVFDLRTRLHEDYELISTNYFTGRGNVFTRRVMLRNIISNEDISKLEYVHYGHDSDLSVPEFVNEMIIPFLDRVEEKYCKPKNN